MTTSCRLSTPSVIGGEVNNNYFDKPSPMPPPPHRREILYNHIQNHPFASEKWRQLLDRFPLNFSLSHSNINLSHKHITQLKKPPEIGRLFSYSSICAKKNSFLSSEFPYLCEYLFASISYLSTNNILINSCSDKEICCPT